MRKLKIHCIRGHRLDADNLYHRADGTKVCAACRKLRRDQHEVRRPKRVKAAGKPRGPKPIPAGERFDTKWRTDPATGCHVWTAGQQGSPYGCFFTRGKPRMVLAHRFSYERHHGPIPKGLHIDHLCRNTLCVNPAHLEAVPPQENHRRAEWKARTHCKRGHEMTPDNVYVRPSGMRRCRQCEHQTRKAWAKTRYLPRTSSSLPSSAGLLSLAFA